MTSPSPLLFSLSLSFYLFSIVFVLFFVLFLVVVFLCVYVCSMCVFIVLVDLFFGLAHRSPFLSNPDEGRLSSRAQMMQRTISGDLTSD